MKREARHLVAKAWDSPLFSVKRFTRPRDHGRVKGGRNRDSHPGLATERRWVT